MKASLKALLKALQISQAFFITNFTSIKMSAINILLKFFSNLERLEFNLKVSRLNLISMATDPFFENFGIPRLAMATVQVTNIPVLHFNIFAARRR